MPTDITRTRDLSEKGMFFTANRPISKQSILDITLRLPIQAESVSLESRVVSDEEIIKNWVYGIRVEFVKLGEEQRNALRRFTQLFLKKDRTLKSQLR